VTTTTTMASRNQGNILRLKGFRHDIETHGRVSRKNAVHVATGRRGFLKCRWGAGNNLAVFVAQARSDSDAAASPLTFQDSKRESNGEHMGASSTCVVELEWNVLPRMARRLIQDGLRIFCQVQQGPRDLLRGQSYQQKLRDSSEAYLRCIDKAAESVAGQDAYKHVRARLLTASTFWHLTEIFYLRGPLGSSGNGDGREGSVSSAAAAAHERTSESIAASLVTWLRDHFFALDGTEPHDASELLDASSHSVLQGGWNARKWKIIQRMLVRGRPNIAHGALLKHPHVVSNRASPTLRRMIDLLTPSTSKNDVVPAAFLRNVEAWRVEAQECLRQATSEDAAGHEDSKGIVETLQLMLGDERRIDAVCDTWKEMFSASLLFKLYDVQRHEFLTSTARRNAPGQRGRRCLQACFERHCRTWVGGRRQEINLYLAISAQDPHASLTAFGLLRMPWMAAHMADLLAHAGHLKPLPPASDDHRNLVANLGGDDCGHAQRALLIEEYVETLLGDSHLWQVASIYALGMETVCGKGRHHLAPTGLRHIQCLAQLIMERAPTDTEVSATRAYTFARQLDLTDACRSICLSRAMRVRRSLVGTGNCGRWLLFADAPQLLEKLALEHIEACVVPCAWDVSAKGNSSRAFDSRQQRRNIDGSSMMKHMHGLLASVSMRSPVAMTFAGIRAMHNVQQYLLVESDIKRSGFDEIIKVATRGKEGPAGTVETCLHRVAARHLTRILEDDDLPRKLIWPVLCMSLPYLQLRSFDVDDVYVLMQRLDDFLSEYSGPQSGSSVEGGAMALRPSAITGSIVSDPKAMRDLGVSSLRDPRKSAPFVQELRCGMSECLSSALLRPPS